MMNCRNCLGGLSSIKNGVLKCNYCGKFYDKELNEIDPFILYEEAIQKANTNLDVDIEAACKIFDALDSYKDSVERFGRCKKILDEKKEAEQKRIAKEEREMERRLRRYRRVTAIKRYGIIMIVVFVVVAFFIGSACHNVKEEAYEEARILYEEGQLEEALKAFSELGDFDSADWYCEQVSNAITERDNHYAQGIGYFDVGLYEKAIEQFLIIHPYLDTNEYIDQASNELYAEGNALYYSENYLSAKAKYIAIPQETEAFRKALEAIKCCNYMIAVNLYQNEKYDEAQEMFLTIRGFSNVDNYLSILGEWYYARAEAAYAELNYIECANLLDRVDTSEEWGAYGRATDLKERLKSEYREFVAKEACEICRVDGETEMNKYLENACCSILSENDAEILREECYVERIALSDLEPYYVDRPGITIGSSNTQCRTDAVGNVYNHTLVGRGGHGSQTYLLSEQYSQLIATISVMKAKDGMMSDEPGFIRIYGDDKLIWADENIKKDMKPYTIDLNIKNVEELRIEMCGHIFGERCLFVLLANPELVE